MCWRNATNALWENSQLSYVQGFVQGSDYRRRELTLHAWCTDVDGRLLEPTWDVRDATGGVVYWGVPFTRDQLANLHLHYGVLDFYDGFADVLKDCK